MRREITDITLVFEGAGITGRRGNLIASSINYVLNVVFTIPAIVYIGAFLNVLTR